MEDLGVRLSYVIGVLEVDSSSLTNGESSIIIGTIEDGWGLLVLILVLFLVLKYMEACLFLFFFGLIGVLREVRVVASSLSRVSGDPSLSSASTASFSPPFVSFSIFVCSISS